MSWPPFLGREHLLCSGGRRTPEILFYRFCVVTPTDAPSPAQTPRATGRCCPQLSLTSGQNACPFCGGPLPFGRSRRFCSSACRQAAYRQRHQSAQPETPLPPRRSRLEGTLYQCPECETRYLAEQWCPDCSTPCQRLGAGGIWPCCEEMITIEELTENTAANSPLPVASTPVHH
jgi:hypothetical protein